MQRQVKVLAIVALLSLRFVNWKLPNQVLYQLPILIVQLQLLLLQIPNLHNQLLLYPIPQPPLTYHITQFLLQPALPRNVHTLILLIQSQILQTCRIYILIIVLYFQLVLYLSKGWTNFIFLLLDLILNAFYLHLVIFPFLVELSN